MTEIALCPVAPTMPHWVEAYRPGLKMEEGGKPAGHKSLKALIKTNTSDF